MFALAVLVTSAVTLRRVDNVNSEGVQDLGKLTRMTRDTMRWMIGSGVGTMLTHVYGILMRSLNWWTEKNIKITIYIASCSIGVHEYVQSLPFVLHISS